MLSSGPSLTARVTTGRLPRTAVATLRGLPSLPVLALWGLRSAGSASPHLWMEMWICRLQRRDAGRPRGREAARKGRRRVAEEFHQDAAAIWAACLDSLEGSGSTHKAWLAQTRPVAITGDVLVLAVPDEFVKEWVEQRYAPTMLASLARIAGRPLGIRVTVREVDDARDEGTGPFQRRYRDNDILLIDDIQFLEGKERTQEEFFHTFNALHNADKQIVISSDRPPKQNATLEDRLRSRFEWGLITDIQPPDLETRIAILRKKSGADGLNVPDDVLSFIASKVQSNIRELEGALIRVTAFASLNRSSIDLSLAEIVLKDLFPDEGSHEVSVPIIMAETASYFGVTIEDLTGSSRSRLLVTARQMAMYLTRELTDLSLPKIGQAFGGRDHTTVMHASQKIRGLMRERRSIYNQVQELTNRIKLRAQQGA